MLEFDEPGLPQITPDFFLSHDCPSIFEHSCVPFAHIVTLSFFYCSFIFHVTASLSLGCFNFQADLPDAQFFLCIRATIAVSRGIMFSCCFLYILKCLTCWAPQLNVNDVFVYLLSALVQHLVIGTVLQQSCVNESIMQYNTVNGSLGWFNYCASECVCVSYTLNLDMDIVCRNEAPVCLLQMQIKWIWDYKE